MTVQQAFEVALQHHRAGRLGEAEAHYRQVLAAQPNHAEARHFLGVIAYQAGRPGLAVDLIRQAIALNPGNATAHADLGEAWRMLGRRDEASASFHRALQMNPNSAEAHHGVGFTFAEQGAWDEAIASYREALRFRPDYPAAYYNMGNALKMRGQLDEAVAAYREVLRVAPQMEQAHNNLGVALADQGRTEEALAAYRRALEIKPNYAAAHNNLGAVLSAQGRLDEAAAAYRRALELDPGYAAAHYNLGSALAAQNRLDEAVASFHRALELNPDTAAVYINLGNVLKRQGRMDEAIAAFRRAAALQPASPDFHWNLALTLLSTGQWQEGWEEYEWRVRQPHLARPDLTAPPWNGEDLSGKTLLIHQEGGFGDVIHFIRYLPLVLARRPARIIFEGAAPILSWMKIQPGIAETVARGEPLPPHDFHCPLPSFPRLFGTRLDNIPASVPYLEVDQEKQSAWRRKLSAPPYQTGSRRQFLVGLNWAGSDLPSDIRSRTLSTFGPLAQVPNVTFVALQKGREAGQAAAPPLGMRFVDAAAEVEDFSDLAALVSCLDAVASVDTSVAHLAGALGISTWTLLSTEADFRWLIKREDSPWYPTMRLFRRQDSLSWEEAVQRLVAVLRSAAESAPESRP